MEVVKNKKDEVVGYMATKEEHENFIDSIIKEILSPEHYKLYKEGKIG